MIYQFLKQLVKIALFFFFKKIVVSGKEHIPDQGPLILVANHPNTFMDPLLVASITSHRLGFIANAGIFLNEFVSKILTYFHVIPILRKKDIPPGEKPDNRDAFRKCHEYLGRKGVILIFPEGNSYYELKLRDIKTGTARIALSYEALKSFKGNLKIVPIALDYSDAIQFRSVVSITVCEPLDITQYQQTYILDEFGAALELTEVIRRELVKIVPQTSGKEQEEFLVNAHHFYTAFYIPKASLNKNPGQSLELRNRVSQALRYLQQGSPDLYADTQAKLFRFFYLLKEDRLSPAIVSNDVANHRLLVLGFYFLKLLMLLPVYITGLILNYIPYMLPVKVFKMMKLDIEYKAPVQMISGLVIFPLYYTLILWLFRLNISKELWYSLLLLIIMPISGYLTMYYYTQFKRFRKLLRYNFTMSRSRRREINDLRTQLLENINKAEADLNLKTGP